MDNLRFSPDHYTYLTAGISLVRILCFVTKEDNMGVHRRTSFFYLMKAVGPLVMDFIFPDGPFLN
jgi:hypothetical protein